MGDAHAARIKESILRFYLVITRKKILSNLKEEKVRRYFGSLGNDK